LYNLAEPSGRAVHRFAHVVGAYPTPMRYPSPLCRRACISGLLDRLDLGINKREKSGKKMNMTFGPNCQ
jgi:hypothetical protein